MSVWHKSQNYLLRRVGTFRESNFLSEETLYGIMMVKLVRAEGSA